MATGLCVTDQLYLTYVYQAKANMKDENLAGNEMEQAILQEPPTNIQINVFVPNVTVKVPLPQTVDRLVQVKNGR